MGRLRPGSWPRWQRKETVTGRQLPLKPVERCINGQAGFDVHGRTQCFAREVRSGHLLADEQRSTVSEGQRPSSEGSRSCSVAAGGTDAFVAQGVRTSGGVASNGRSAAGEEHQGNTERVESGVVRETFPGSGPYPRVRRGSGQPLSSWVRWVPNALATERQGRKPDPEAGPAQATSACGRRSPLVSVLSLRRGTTSRRAGTPKGCAGCAGGANL